MTSNDDGVIFPLVFLFFFFQCIPTVYSVAIDTDNAVTPWGDVIIAFFGAFFSFFFFFSVFHFCL